MRLLLCLVALLPLPATALEQVALQLKWKHQFQFAGYYAAQEKGYYRDAGLEVELREAGPETDPVGEVLGGRAQFGVSNSALILERARDKPVVAIAVIFQHSPFILAARRQSGIRSVHDLAGKRLMFEPHAEEVFAYLRREGISEKQLTLLPHSLDHQDLIDGRTDVVTAYSTDEPYFFEQKKFAYLEFLPRAAGIDFYGDNLFASADEIARHPDRVKAFRDASLKGWAYAMQHPEEIADLIVARYGQRKSREHLLYEAREMVSLLRPDLVEIGHMNPGRWRHIADTYADLGMMARDFPLEGFLYDPEPQTDRRMTAAATASTLVAMLLAAALIGFIILTHRLRREIAVRRQIEDELRESDRKFRTIAETTPVALLITRPGDGRILYANQTAADLGGLPIEELIDSDVTRFYPDPAERQRFLEELRTTGSVRNQIVEFVREDGTSLMTQRSATLGSLDDQPALFVAIADLRERKRLETDLKESNAMLQAQLDEIHRLQADLREQAVRDGLTNLFNRRYLDETLERELARAKREGYPLSLVMIDID
ncbi:MAG: ABC transporter substrate-binding protein, partial [Rhodocyclaceae bacterium]|nr:ABC transporter substrate-binding protein [Rhodocyclaceae bacterium]